MADYLGSQMNAPGPFLSATEYFNAHVQLTLDLISQQGVYVNVTVDSFLIHRFHLDKLLETCTMSDLK